MPNYLITIAGRRFTAPENDIAQIRARITTAVQSGGAFVPMHVRDQTVQALISPGSAVFIDELPSEERQVAGAATVETAAPAHDEFDEWGI
ncbi:hypothetical protein [Leifsonia xyli]|uniref:hypothetical protein n=1 Tax=Leifsonia xyli TaxID=1575 RepID=UPI003D67C93C